MTPLHYILKKIIQTWGYINYYDPKEVSKEETFMKANVKKIVKTLAKIIVVYYVIELIATAIMVAINTVMVGWEPTKRIIKNSLAHAKKFYKKLFHGRFKDAVQECVDAELDGAYVNLESGCGKESAEGFMEAMYDGLEGILPYSRNRCPADNKKKPADDGLNTIIKNMVHSGEYPEYDLDDLESQDSESFETHPIDPDEVPADILRSAGDID